MENLASSDDKKEELYLTNYMKKELKGAANWALFLAISMLIFFGIYLISILSNIKSLPIFETTENLIGFILVVVFLGLILGMGILLFSFSSNLKKALFQKESILLNQSFDSLTRYFILSFVILLVTPLITFLITFFHF